MPASVSRAANSNAAPKIAPTNSAWKIDIALSPPPLCAMDAAACQSHSPSIHSLFSLAIASGSLAGSAWWSTIHRPAVSCQK